MSDLSLALLGPISVADNIRNLATFQTERTKALLFFLTTETVLGTAVFRREALMELLWPGVAMESARVNLRQTLYLLRQAVPDLPGTDGDETTPFLLTDRYRVQINPSYPLQVDVATFLRLLDGPKKRWPEAVALYRGDFLTDFYLADANTFEEWAASRRAAFRRQALDVLDKLTASRLQEGAFDEAERFGHRQLEIDNLRESAYRQLMRLYAWSGRQAEALSLYEECARLLEIELDTAPDATSQALHEAIRENQLPPPPTAAPIEAVSAAPAEAPPSPYRGLFAFREEDAPFFFGREEFTDRILAAARRQPLVAVIGPSGIGKSSVVYAGLVASLRQEGGWLVTSFRPGGRPFQALAGGLIGLLEPMVTETERLVETGRLATALMEGNVELSAVVERLVDKHPTPEGSAPRLLLVADQFEELFTLVTDRAVRHRFLDTLFAPALEQRFKYHPLCTRVLTLRADFLGRALAYRPLADALQEADVKLGPMTRAELERAIVNPAQKQGVNFSPGLVARILDEVGDEPGSLPLLAFALEALWKHQKEGRLSHEGYEAIGRVQGALALYADAILAELGPDDQALARRIFIQLVHPGEGTEDTRRLATKEELGDEAWPLVQRLAGNRLLVTDRDAAGRETVEMVHEALIGGWDQLREWLEADRAFRVWQEQLRASLRTWTAHERDESALLRGVALATAEEWLERRPADLNAAERDYIMESISLRERRRARVERARAERERLRRTRTWILGAGLALVTVLVVLVGIQWRQAEGQRQALLDAQVSIVEERDLAQQALADQLALVAQNLLEEQSSLALLLALEASRRYETQATRETLAIALAHNPRLLMRKRVLQGSISTMAISPDGRTLAFGGETGEIFLWRVQLIPFTIERLQPITLPSALPLRALVFGREGRTLAAVQRNGAYLYHLAQSSTAQPDILVTSSDANSEDIRDMAFSRDGTRLALGTGEGNVQLWDVAEHRLVASLDVESYIRAVDFTPDGRWIIAGSADGTLTLWNPTAEESHQTTTEMAVFDLASSPDSTHVALVGSPSRVEIWELNPLQQVAAATDIEANILQGVAFHPDGRLLTAGNDGHLVLWRADGPQLVAEPLSGHRDAVRAVAVDDGGKWLAAAGQDGLLTIWNGDGEPTSGFRLAGHEGLVEALAFADNQRLASVACEYWTWFSTDNPPSTPCAWAETGNWYVAEPTTAKELHRPSEQSAPIVGLDLAPDARTAVFGYQDGSVVLWDIVENRQSGVFEQPEGRPVVSFAFDDAQSLMAAGACLERDLGGFCQEGEVRLWNLQQPLETPRVISGLEGLPLWLALSSDGRWLASALQVAFGDGINSFTTSVLLWDLSEEDFKSIQLDTDGENVLGGSFDPDDNLLAASSNMDRLRLWRLPEREAEHVPVTRRGTTIGHAFSAGRQYLALGGCAGAMGTVPPLFSMLGCSPELLVLDLETTRLLPLPFTGHTRTIITLAFSPDGKILATGDAGGDIMLWDLSVAPETVACRRAGRNLTTVEWQRYFGDEPYRPTCPDL